MHCWYNVEQVCMTCLGLAPEASAMRSLCCQTSNAIAHSDLSPLFQNLQVYVCTYVRLLNHGKCVVLPGCTLLPGPHLIQLAEKHSTHRSSYQQVINKPVSPLKLYITYQIHAIYSSSSKQRQAASIKQQEPSLLLRKVV